MGIESELAAEAEPDERRTGESSARAILGRDIAEIILLDSLSLAFSVSLLVPVVLDAAFTGDVSLRAGLALDPTLRFKQ